MLVFGGALIGYAIADSAWNTGSRLPRIGIGLLGANLGWIGQLWITATFLPTTELLPSIVNFYPVGVTMALIGVILIEGWVLLIDNPRGARYG